MKRRRREPFRPAGWHALRHSARPSRSQGLARPARKCRDIRPWRGRHGKPRRCLPSRAVPPPVGPAMPGATSHPARARPTIPAPCRVWAPSGAFSRFASPSEGKSGRQAARCRVLRPHRRGNVGAKRPGFAFRVPIGGEMWVPTGAFSRFRPHRRGNVGAISAATFVSHPEAGDDGRRLPARRALTRPGRDVLVNAPAVFPVRSADRGTDARSTSLLVNRLAVFPVRPADRGTDARSRRLLVNAPAVFPVRPADGGGAHGDVSGPRDPSWPFSGVPAADSLLIRRHPRSLYTYPPFFVHSVHFAVPIRLRAILPDALAQFRGVFLKPCRTDRGWWVGRRADEPALARSTRPGKTPQPPIRSTRAVFSCNPD